MFITSCRSAVGQVWDHHWPYISRPS